MASAGMRIGTIHLLRMRILSIINARKLIDYTHGLDKINDIKEIEKKKLDLEFPREYECP
jgi:hypothetical protein